jgi:hypothetical protein
MGDSTGGLVLRYVAWGCGVLWAINAICLLLAHSVNSLADTDDDE